MTVSYKATLLFCLLFAFPLLTGCLGSQELSSIQGQFERDHPEAEFRETVAVSAGPLTLSNVWRLTRLSDIAELQPITRSVEGIKLGVYSIEGTLSDARYTPDFLNRLVGRGWVVTARIMDPPDQTWLMYNARQERIRELYLVQLDDENLVVVRLRGNVERIIGSILSNDHWNLDERARTLMP